MGKDVILLLIGAGIGVFASIATLIAERWFNHAGRIKIYYKIYSADPGRGRAYGFSRTSDGKLHFRVPIIFEIQNTSYATRVIRDVSLVLYKGQTLVSKMQQVNDSVSTLWTGNDVTGTNTVEYGGENNSYSLVLEPTSIKKVKCLYVLVINENESAGKQFDTVQLEYFDERDRKRTFVIAKINDCWKEKRLQISADWILAS